MFVPGGVDLEEAGSHDHQVRQCVAVGWGGEVGSNRVGDATWGDHLSSRHVLRAWMMTQRSALLYLSMQHLRPSGHVGRSRRQSISWCSKHAQPHDAMHRNAFEINVM